VPYELGTAVDVNDEHPIAASLRFLWSASRTLASSFDFDRTLGEVGAALVPRFADGFVVAIDEDRTERWVGGSGTLATPPARGDLMLPLMARDRHLGYVHIALGGRAPAPLDREIFDELAVRIAVAIDSAQIYAREHHVADTLQRALLPERLPAGKRLTFDAAYLPGASESIVGGDWYDAFELPDGRIACSVGDVAGHGLRAAIIMGEVRQAFRAAALNPKSPSLVLERANTIVNMRSTPIMVTAVFGILDPQTGTFTYATAGHPAPIIALPDGTVQKLPKDGIPLGIADSTESSDWTFTLPAGSLLALYTDGLIEYTRDVIAGEERLLAALREEIVEPATAPARSLVSRVFRDIKNADDVAVLGVAMEDAPAKDFTFDFTGIPVAVPLVRRSLQRYLRTLDLTPDDRFAVITSIGEALANAVEHAYSGGGSGIVRLRVSSSDDVLTATVEDDGRWRPAQRHEERGRGLPMMRALMSGVEIQTNQARTSVRLTLELSA